MATILAVSPHLDDAVLSHGGRLSHHIARGDQVIVYTVFAGRPSPPYSPAAVSYHALWDLPDDPVRARVAEDERAMALLGARPVYGPFLDGIYRRDGKGDWLVPQGGRCSGDRSSPEPELVDRIAAAVTAVIASSAPAVVLTCAAIGDHVDHARARNGTVLAAARAGLPLRCWEDMPYGIRTDYLPPLPAGAMLSDPRIEPVDEIRWQAKMAATSCYSSQAAMLVYRGQSIAGQLEAHGRDRGAAAGYGELSWDVVLDGNWR